jgi:DNA-binding transcriptional MocR family regulator
VSELRGHDLSTLRKLNNRAVLAALYSQEGPFTVRGLADAAGLSRPTVEAALAELSESGWVADAPRLPTARAGRAGGADVDGRSHARRDSAYPRRHPCCGRRGTRRGWPRRRDRDDPRRPRLAGLRHPRPHSRRVSTRCRPLRQRCKARRPRRNRVGRPRGRDLDFSPGRAAHRRFHSDRRAACARCERRRGRNRRPLQPWVVRRLRAADLRWGPLRRGH